jgi:hypothetical protein
MLERRRKRKRKIILERKSALSGIFENIPTTKTERNPPISHQKNLL